jgi:hypothetical protein
MQFATHLCEVKQLTVCCIDFLLSFLNILISILRLLFHWTPCNMPYSGQKNSLPSQHKQIQEYTEVQVVKNAGTELDAV